MPAAHLITLWPSPLTFYYQSMHGESLPCTICVPSFVLQQQHPFNGPLPGTTQVSRYQKGKTNLVFTGARDNESQWHQLGHTQICTTSQADNQASTQPAFLPSDATLARVLAVGLYLFVCLCVSVTRQYCIETTACTELIWHTGCPRLCFKKIRVSSKLEYFLLEVCLKLWAITLWPRHIHCQHPLPSATNKRQSSVCYQSTPGNDGR